MNKIFITCTLLIFSGNIIFSQSKTYHKMKVAKIKDGSIFTKITNRKSPATIVYEDSDIIAFVPPKIAGEDSFIDCS